MKKLFKNVVSKFNQKPILMKVLLNKNVIVATDSYILLEIIAEYLAPTKWGAAYSILSSKSPKGIMVSPEELNLPTKILEVLPKSGDDPIDFPKYKELLPTDEALEANYVSILVNPEKLMHIAKAMNDANALSDNKEIKTRLYIPRVSGKPIIMRREDKMVTGLVMPLNK